MSYRADTLAYQLHCRPGARALDRSDVPLPVVANQCKTYKAGSDSDFKPNGKALPEEQAISFYMMNHASMVVRQRCALYEPLGQYLPVMNDYHRFLVQASVRMFYYLLWICTRETRHAGVSSSLESKFKEKGWGKFVAFRSTLHGSKESVERLIYNPPQGNLGEYTQFMRDTFYEASFSGGYGGPKWGQVADCLNNFVKGNYSAEMMMDTAFTLCHNNGPIFNKGMLFEMYSKYDITQILDVQRSGQMPKFVINSESKYVNSGHREWALQYQKLLGEDFDQGGVDWYLVEELGSMQKYTKQKENQTVKPSEEFIKKVVAKKKVDKPIDAAEKDPNTFLVMPGLAVKKVKVPRAAGSKK